MKKQHLLQRVFNFKLSRFMEFEKNRNRIKCFYKSRQTHTHQMNSTPILNRKTLFILIEFNCCCNCLCWGDGYGYREFLIASERTIFLFNLHCFFYQFKIRILCLLKGTSLKNERSEKKMKTFQKIKFQQ